MKTGVPLRGRTVLATEFDSNLMWLFAGSVLKLQWSIQLPLSGLSKLCPGKKLSEFLSLLFSFNGLPPRPSLAEFLALVCSFTGYPVDQPTLERSLTNLSVGYQEVDTCSCAPVHAPGQLDVLTEFLQLVPAFLREPSSMPMLPKAPRCRWITKSHG